MKPLDALRAHWDRALALALTLLGLLMLVVGYFRISDTPYPAEQLPLLMSAGVGSLFALGVGATLWLSADLRDEWHKLDELDASTARPVAEPTAEPAGQPAGQSAPEPVTEVRVQHSDDGARATAR